MKEQDKNKNHNEISIFDQNYIKERYFRGNPITAEEIRDTLKKPILNCLRAVLWLKLKMSLATSKYDYKNKKIDSSRNGYSKKMLKSDVAGEFEVDIPRDRNSEYEPKLVKKHLQRRDIHR